MKIQDKIPAWAARGARILAHRAKRNGSIQGLILCALDKDCNLIAYGIGEAVETLGTKIKEAVKAEEAKAAETAILERAQDENRTTEEVRKDGLQEGVGSVQEVQGN